VAAYAEKEGERSRAAANYSEAAHWYEDASKTIANDLKISDFFGSVLGKEILVGLGAAVTAAQGDNALAAEIYLRQQLAQHPPSQKEAYRRTGVTFAALARICRERAEALQRPD
jgi:hypothetical protein